MRGIVLKAVDISLLLTITCYVSGKQEHKAQAVFNHTEDYVLFPDEATTSLCAWNSRNASRKQLLSLGKLRDLTARPSLCEFYFVVANTPTSSSGCLCIRSQKPPVQNEVCKWIASSCRFIQHLHCRYLYLQGTPITG
jgi:hypothetical protein